VAQRTGQTMSCGTRHRIASHDAASEKLKTKVTDGKLVNGRRGALHMRVAFAAVQRAPNYRGEGAGRIAQSRSNFTVGSPPFTNVTIN
jgi:hypothetical protein